VEGQVFSLHKERRVGQPMTMCRFRPRKTVSFTLVDCESTLLICIGDLHVMVVLGNGGFHVLALVICM
jgi:hypothetical protein